MIPAVDRVLARIEITDAGCWEFQGALNHGGYGIAQRGGRGEGTDRTHRIVYRARVGPIEPGATIDHLCGNTRCVNPEHLEQVSRAENTRRQWAAGRADPGRHNRSKTHCPKGHPYNEANTIRSGNHRACRTCNREDALARWRASRAREGNPAPATST